MIKFFTYLCTRTVVFCVIIIIVVLSLATSQSFCINKQEFEYFSANAMSRSGNYSAKQGDDIEGLSDRLAADLRKSIRQLVSLYI